MSTPNQVDIHSITTFKNKFKTIGNIDIAYKEEGQGDVIFCLPPWPSGSTAFTPFIHALKDNFRIIALDLPGWAGYSGKMTLNPSIDNYTTIVEDFISSFNVKDYTLLGYSFGGALVQSLVERGNTKPKKLIFVSTLHSGNEINTKFYKLLRVYKFVSKFKIVSPIKKQLFGAFFLGGRVVGSSYYKKYLRTAFYKQLIKERLRANIDKIFGAMFSLFHSEYIDPIEKNFDCLVMYADADPEFIKSETIEMAKYIGCEPTVIQNADHDHFTFDVNKSTQIIQDFLQQKDTTLEKVKKIFTSL